MGFWKWTLPLRSQTKAPFHETHVARNKATSWCRRPLGGQSLTLGLCPKWRPNRKGLSFGEESWWKDPLFPGTAKLFDQSFPFGEKGSEKNQKTLSIWRERKRCSSQAMAMVARWSHLDRNIGSIFSGWCFWCNISMMMIVDNISYTNPCC